MNIKHLFLLFITLSFLTSCNYKGHQEEVIKIIANYYNLFNNDHYEELLKLYSNEFFSMTPWNEWKNTLIMVLKKLGKYKSHRLKELKIVNNVGINGISINVTIICEVKYTNNLSIETFLLKKSIFEKRFLIVGQFINSEVLK